MITYTREKIKRVIKIDFVRFCIVGGTGFVINLILLNVLKHYLHFPVFFAQLVSAEVALFSNFILHHNWTYKSKKIKKSIPSLLIQFHATSWPAIVGSSFMVAGGVKYLKLNSSIALALTSAIVLVWNFAWTKYVIWHNVTKKDIEEIVK